MRNMSSNLIAMIRDVQSAGKMKDFFGPFENSEDFEVKASNNGGISGKGFLWCL